MKIVIKGLPTFIETEEIKEELTDYGNTINKINRMYRKLPENEKRFYSSVLVQISITPKNEEIYNLRVLQDMEIQVEPKRTFAAIPQCHRCQRYRHNHFGCKMPPRCHKCAGNHHFIECTKPRNIPAKCCNCEGAHPANAHICPRRPNQQLRNILTNTNQQQTNPHTPTRSQTRPVNKDITYAKAANPTINLTNHLLTTINQMNDATNALTAYLTSNNSNVQH